MNYFTKERLLFGAVIFLLLLNIGTLSTIWIIKEEGHSGKHFRKDNKYNKRNNTTAFLTNELKLTDKQQKLMEKERDDHFSGMNNFFEEIQGDRLNLFHEAMKENLDSGKISLIIENIADKHAELFRLNMQHYINMSAILDSTQKEKFREIFFEIFQNPPSHGHFNNTNSDNPCKGKRGIPLHIFY